MGGGSWSGPAYSTKLHANIADHGTPMPYSAAMASTPVHDRKAHEDLDPKRVNKAGANVGKITRESLDSDEHPETLPIAILFDETGSMGRLPLLLQSKLPALHGLLMRKGYVEHPQILFGAIGDAYNMERAPLQISQFESDNRMDDHLSHIYLEGQGGGGNHESYELGMYFLARHTELDSLNKRGKKGYCFIIGDERVYSTVDRVLVEKLIGDTLQDSIPTEDIVRELQEKFEVYFLFAAQASYKRDQVLDAPNDGQARGWTALLGQNAMILDDAEAVCEVIAMTVGLAEGALAGVDEALDHLRAAGTDSKVVEAAGRALATVGVGSGSGGSVVPTGGDFPGAAAASGTEPV